MAANDRDYPGIDVMWRDVFFTRRASPILQYVRFGKAERWSSAAWLAFALAAILVFDYLFKFKIRHSRADEEEMFGSLLLILFVGTDIAAILYGSTLGWLKSIDRRGQISELLLTELRRIEICQFVMARRFWRQQFEAAVLTLALAACHLFFFPRAWYYAPAFFLFGINAVITLEMHQWIQAERFFAGRRSSGYILQFVYFLGSILIFLAGMTICWPILVPFLGETHQKDFMAVIAASFPAILLVWYFKYRIAAHGAGSIEVENLHREKGTTPCRSTISR